MEITEIKKIGKGRRYYLFVNGNNEGDFESEILAKYQLKTGQEIDLDFLKKIKIENGDLAAFDRALGYLEKGMKSEKGIRDYLRGKGYPDECVDRAASKLKEYGYIDDSIFAENFIRTYSNSKGRRKIKYDLLAKGIDGEIIEEKLESIFEREDEEMLCARLAEKYLKNKEIDQKTKEKLYRHLAGKGFSFDMISSVVRKVTNGRD